MFYIAETYYFEASQVEISSMVSWLPIMLVTQCS